MTQCQIAYRLLHKWAKQVQDANMQTWTRIMFSSRQLDRHQVKCRKCRQIKAMREKKIKELQS